MNEHEWKNARYPEAMLAAVQDRLTRRKWMELHCAVSLRMRKTLRHMYPEGYFYQYQRIPNSGRPEEPGFGFGMLSVTPHLDHLQLSTSPRREFLNAAFDIDERLHSEKHGIDKITRGYFDSFPELNEYDYVSAWERLRRRLSGGLYCLARHEVYRRTSDLFRQLAESAGSEATTPSTIQQSYDTIRTVQKQLVLDMNKAMRNYAKPANELLGHFLHEQLGNPYQPYVFDPAWRTADVMGLARGIEADSSFDRMNMLADALMEAGCEQEGMLLHLQEEREHQSGCWVLDLILGHDSELFARPPLEDVSGTGGRHEPLGLALPRNWDV